MENSPNRFPFWYLVSQKFHSFLVIILGSNNLIIRWSANQLNHQLREVGPSGSNNLIIRWSARTVLSKSSILLMIGLYHLYFIISNLSKYKWTFSRKSVWYFGRFMTWKSFTTNKMELAFNCEIPNHQLRRW